LKKKLWLLLLLSFMTWNLHSYVSFAEETKTVSTEQNDDSSKLNKEIQDLKEEIKVLKEDKKLSTDTMSKEDLYKALLDREKDVSSGLYNFTMFFVSFIALAVAIGVIYFGKLGRDLKEHQKKIDLVMDSKEFDEKMSKLQKKLSEVEAKERLASEKSLERYIKDCIKRTEFVINDIDDLMTKDFFTPKMSEILKREEYDFHKYGLSDLKKRYKQCLESAEEYKRDGLTTPYDRSYSLIIDNYTRLEGQFEEVSNKLEIIHEKIGESLASDENK